MNGSSSFKPHNLSYTLEPSFVRTVDPIRMLVFSLAPSSVKLAMAGVVVFCPTINLSFFLLKDCKLEFTL